MYAEYLVVDYHAQGKKVEHIGEVMPYISIPIFSRAFSIESV